MGVVGGAPFPESVFIIYTLLMKLGTPDFEKNSGSEVGLKKFLALEFFKKNLVLQYTTEMRTHIKVQMKNLSIQLISPEHKYTVVSLDHTQVSDISQASAKSSNVTLGCYHTPTLQFF